MADPKNLSDKDLQETLFGTALAGDITRAAGLELAAEIAELRAEQAAIEAARLRFRKGADAPEAKLPEAAATARLDRREAAVTIGEELRKNLDKVGRKPERPDRDDPREPEPIIDDDLRPRPDPIFDDDLRRPDRDGGFTLDGVVEGVDAPSALKIDLRLEGARRAIASTEPERTGKFLIDVRDVALLRRKLDMPADQELVFMVVARSGNRIVARAPEPMKMVAGESRHVTLVVD